MKQGEAGGGQIFALSSLCRRGRSAFRSADSLVVQSERNEARCSNGWRKGEWDVKVGEGESH